MPIGTVRVANKKCWVGWSDGRFGIEPRTATAGDLSFEFFRNVEKKWRARVGFTRRCQCRAQCIIGY